MACHSFIRLNNDWHAVTSIAQCICKPIINDKIPTKSSRTFLWFPDPLPPPPHSSPSRLIVLASGLSAGCGAAHSSCQGWPIAPHPLSGSCMVRQPTGVAFLEPT